MDQSAVADRLHGRASCGTASRVFTETIRGDRLKERSQNCRVVEAGRYFCEIVQSRPCLELDKLELCSVPGPDRF